MPAKHEISALLLSQHLQNPVLTTQGSSYTENPRESATQRAHFSGCILPLGMLKAQGAASCCFAIPSCFSFLCCFT